MAKQTLQVIEEHGSIRVDKLLALEFPEYSRAALAKLFDLKLIKLNGEPILAGHKLKVGATIEYDLGPLQAKPEVTPLPVIYEDDNVIVVDKPAGIISHARGRFWQEASVASFIRDRICGMDGERGGIVHRLDRATSGVMICAKNEATLKFLQKQFHDRKVSKTYLAVVEKDPKEAEAKIIAPIARNFNDPKLFCVSPEGKHAETEYKVVGKNTHGSVIELKPLTGRTHQLRIHLQSIGRPIIGDILYGGKPYHRLLLHARSLEIHLPDHSEKSVFLSEAPEEFSV
jgi:23S rRNA pseudouridine1911/1915/1917 synthase